jgi:valyl-tRNA synthetase
MTEKRQTSQGYIIRILQHFATKLWNITNFVMLFQAVIFLRILRNHVNDETLDKGYAAATWKIDDVNKPYRYLRVRQTGKNEAGKDSLRLSGFEVYGQLVLND